MRAIHLITALLLCSWITLAAAIPAAQAAPLTPRAELNRAEEYALARFCAAHLNKEAKQAGLDTMLEELEMILSDEILQRKERMRQRAESE